MYVKEGREEENEALGWRVAEGKYGKDSKIRE